MSCTGHFFFHRVLVLPERMTDQLCLFIPGQSANIFLKKKKKIDKPSEPVKETTNGICCRLTCIHHCEPNRFPILKNFLMRSVTLTSITLRNGTVKRVGS